MNNCVQYLLTVPWPKVGKQPSNRQLVRNLFTIYSGADGELTAFTQYFYNSLVAAADGLEDLSDLFACISQSEMHHLKKLGELILLYGGDPRLLSYRNNRPQWWSGGYVQYTSDPHQMLQQAIASEQASIVAYRAIAEQMAPEPRALIERIIQDERHHLELFQRAMQQLSENT